MVHYSKTSGYAIHALSCIGAAHPEGRLVRDVAEETGMRKPYLAKIMKPLVRCGLVKTKRGYKGGIVLARPANKITLFEVVKAVEGDARVGTCVFGLDVCPAQGQCPAHQFWGGIGKKVEAVLRKTRLSDVIATTPLPCRAQKKAPKRK